MKLRITYKKCYVSVIKEELPRLTTYILGKKQLEGLQIINKKKQKKPIGGGILHTSEQKEPWCR